MVVEVLASWAPFRIDALGLVTMIGAEEVDRSIGRLVDSPWTEYLPLLGAFIVAGNRFIEPIPGMTLYNVSDSIVATDVSGWLGRWLVKQDVRWNTTAYIWGTRNAVRRDTYPRIQALLVGLLANGALIALSALVRDWFGLVNAAVLALSVAVRRYMLSENRRFLDNVAGCLRGTDAEMVKVFCTLANGRAVTLFAPRGIVTKGFLTTPRPDHRGLYAMCRAVGWVTFGLHVICIGQTTLFIQILTVVCMITATVVCIYGFGCDELSIGRKMHIYALNDLGAADDRRTMAYARLRLTDEEENSMLSWGLLPQRSNTEWWENYTRQKPKEIAPWLGYWNQLVI